MSSQKTKTEPFWIINKFGKKHKWRVFQSLPMTLNGERIIYRMVRCQKCGIVGRLVDKKVYIPRKYNKREVVLCREKPYDIYKKRTYRLKN